MTQDDIDKLLSSSRSRAYGAEVGKSFICELVAQKGAGQDCFFTSWQQERSSPRKTCCAEVSVYDRSVFKRFHGKLIICNDPDLSESCKLSVMLLVDKAGKTMSISTTEVKVKLARLKPEDFIKLVKFKPASKPADPFEHYGLAIAAWPKAGSREVCMEFTADGKAYAECIDWADYCEGDIIQIESPRRDVIVNYEPLTQDTASSIAADVNSYLETLYRSNTDDKDRQS